MNVDHRARYGGMQLAKNNNRRNGSKKTDFVRSQIIKDGPISLPNGAHQTEKVVDVEICIGNR